MAILAKHVRLDYLYCFIIYMYIFKKQYLILVVVDDDDDDDDWLCGMDWAGLALIV